MSFMKSLFFRDSHKEPIRLREGIKPADEFLRMHPSMKIVSQNEEVFDNITQTEIWGAFPATDYKTCIKETFIAKQ